MPSPSFKGLAMFAWKLNGLGPRNRCYQFSRTYAITGNATADKAINTATAGRAEHWLDWYENAVGLAEVRDAQGKVVQAEENFLKVQDRRRQKQFSLGEVQGKLRLLSAELEKVHRGDERYLALLTQEHAVIKEETRVQEEIALLEEQERGSFSSLSSAVRDSHEKERARTERTKYWSVIGSIVGACIGIIGTSINNYLRMRELRGLVTDSTEGGAETRGLVTQLSETMKSQHNQMQSFISDLRTFLGPGEEAGKTEVKKVNGSINASESVQKVEGHTKEIMGLIQKQESTIQKEMKEIKDFLASVKITDEEGKVVSVAPTMGNMLENTEKNLEWKMKLNSLWTVTFIYGAFALTIPVLYNMFRGGGS